MMRFLLRECQPKQTGCSAPRLSEQTRERERGGQKTCSKKIYSAKGGRRRERGEKDRGRQPKPPYTISKKIKLNQKRERERERLCSLFLSLEGGDFEEKSNEIPTLVTEKNSVNYSYSFIDMTTDTVQRSLLCDPQRDRECEKIQYFPHYSKQDKKE